MSYSKVDARVVGHNMRESIRTAAHTADVPSNARIVQRRALHWSCQFITALA